MTAPAGDGPRTDTAERLAATFGHEPVPVDDRNGPTGRTACGNCFTDWPCAVVRKIERVMVPVVARLAREQAAEELLKAGGYFHDQGVRDELILGYLDRRAAALRGDR